MPNCIIAYTSEDDRFAEVRQAAMEQAYREGSRLILYDIDAATPFAKPLPTFWSAEDAEHDVPSRLTVADLEAAGRESIARQVQEAIEMGIDAFGWLPGEGGGDALAQYADEQRADMIMIPEELEHGGLISRLRGRTAEAIKEEAHSPVVVVHTDGHLSAVDAA
jgi:nucleotide-binding universal stress UspA family protein